MGGRNLPELSSPSLDELRRLWRQHQAHTEYDETIRRLIVDVVRLRRLVVELDRLTGAVRRAWRDETRSNLVALEQLRVLFNRERSRNGVLSSEPPPVSPDALRRFP